jgi:glycerol-3-phosphate dehydrogenase
VTWPDPTCNPPAPAMRRDLEHISRTRFDLVVVGGGIYGAWTALDAAQRGLTVALLEQGDFGAATSSNHHKIIHGGLRYLQHGDIRRMRQSIRERSILLRCAPELVRPMPVLVPTSSHWSQHRALLGTAILLSDLIGAGANRGLAGPQRIPRSRLIDRAACAQLAPGIDFNGSSGGALFHDAQVLSPERLIIAILRSAGAAGAALANHVRATAFLRDGQRISGVRACDMLTGAEFDVQARLVLNCVGPWSAQQAQLIEPAAADSLTVFKAAVLVVRDLGLKTALALAGRRPYSDGAEVLRRNYRNYFLTPWRGLSLVGTFYAPHDGPADTCRISEGEIRSWLDEINTACPSLALKRADVLRVLAGLLPRAGSSGPDQLVYEKRYRIIDHAHHSAPGALTVVGVKFTTARGVAERALDMAIARLGCRAAPCITAHMPLPCDPGPGPDICRESALLQSNAAALRVALRRAVRQEMACTLADALLRRTELAAVGPVPESVLSQCAAIMGEELRWNLLRRQREMQSVRALSGAGGFVHAA